jgi:hypothetical protein
MIYFIKYKYHPNKHELMPDEYPWQIVEQDDSNPHIESMAQEDYDAYLASFDLTAYFSQIQREADTERYLNRALVKDSIVAWMATENMQRVRSGVWTVPQLVGLTQDDQLKLVLDDVNTLSFELAQGKIQAITNPMITTEIKLQWISKLQENMF